nr:hypothetical protein [Mycoplasma haemocanis]
MPISTFKWLKIVGPVLTGIGGIIATSSLISKSAEEKPEEKLKTKALTDEDPTIKEWKDRNESEGNQGEGDGNPSSDSDTSNGGNQNETQPKNGKESTSEGQGKNEGTETSTSDEESGAESSSKEGGDASISDTGEGSEGVSEEESSGNGVTDIGSKEADYNHALGNAYGNIDRAMTAHEVEKTKQLKSNLEGLLGDLRGLVLN